MAPASYSPPPVQQKSVRPPGNLPPNIQFWLIGGLALVMVLIIAFSGRNAPKERPVTNVPQGLTAIDPNEARIREYRTRLEEQARKLAEEQAQLAQNQQTLGRSGGAFQGPDARTSSDVTSQSYRSDAASFGERTSLQSEKEKREYQSLFASNVAVDLRKSEEPAREAEKAEQPEAGTKTAGHDTKRSDPDLQQAEGPTYRVFEGTVLESVLTNRLDGSFSGPINCLVATNVFSHDRLHRLIPQGSRVLGEVRKLETFGQQRLAVVFHRLIMPDGYSVTLDKLPGLNQVGETGLLDQVNHHYFQVFGVSLAIGAIAGLSQANTRYGADASSTDAYRQGVAGSLSQSSLNILDRYLNVLPTFTIREGHRVKVYLTEDLLLPDYDKHRLPSSL
jgi:type IV secretion system protein TrbI